MAQFEITAVVDTKDEDMDTYDFTRQFFNWVNSKDWDYNGNIEEA